MSMVFVYTHLAAIFMQNNYYMTLLDFMCLAQGHNAWGFECQAKQAAELLPRVIWLFELMPPELSIKY